MNEDENYYCWNPLIVGMLLYAFPENVILEPGLMDESGKEVPRLFHKENHTGRHMWSYGFREGKRMARFVYSNYVDSDLPEIEPLMRKFIKHYKSQPHE